VSVHDRQQTRLDRVGASPRLNPGGQRGTAIRGGECRPIRPQRVGHLIHLGRGQESLALDPQHGYRDRRVHRATKSGEQPRRKRRRRLRLVNIIDPVAPNLNLKRGFGRRGH
jgi:hypothetical protein